MALPHVLVVDGRAYRATTLDACILVADQATLHVNLSHSVSVQIGLSSANYLGEDAPGLHRYACTVRGPDATKMREAALTEVVERGGRLMLHLYHHTSDAAMKAILAQQQLFGSKRNYAGLGLFVDRKFSYFTNKTASECAKDLRAVGMTDAQPFRLGLDSMLMTLATQ
jgi:hypothetical protein